MAFYLSNLLQAAYSKLGQANYSTATSGSTIALADTKQATIHGDNAWKDGACFLVRDVDGASAAPENEFSLVTAYTDSTGSFATAWTAAPASGDTFMFVNDFYPLYTMRELANAALRALGPIPLIDTSLTTAVNQTEYAVPVAAKRGAPIRIDYQGRTGDANDNQYTEVRDWRYEPATAGSTGLLVIPQLVSGRTLRIWYMGVHPTLTAYNSAVVESIEPELATAVLAEKALEWQNTRLQGGDDFLIQRWNDQKQQVVASKALWTPWRPKRRAKLLIIGGGRRDPDNLNDPDPGVRT